MTTSTSFRKKNHQNRKKIKSYEVSVNPSIQSAVNTVSRKYSQSVNTVKLRTFFLF